MKPTPEQLGRAAQLWCLPQHSHKEMDSRFAESIAQALADEYALGMERARWAITGEKYVSECEYILFALAGDPVAIKNGWLERAAANVGRVKNPRANEIAAAIRAEIGSSDAREREGK